MAAVLTPGTGQPTNRFAFSDDGWRSSQTFSIFSGRNETGTNPFLKDLALELGEDRKRPAIDPLVSVVRSRASVIDTKPSHVTPFISKPTPRSARNPIRLRDNKRNCGSSQILLGITWINLRILRFDWGKEATRYKIGREE
jgi:hypothetical protein